MAITDHPAMRSRSGNPYLPHSLRDDSNVIPFPHRPAPPLQTKGGVPVGTSVQIQEWVGNDPDRALLALEREKESERPRITLLAHLQSVLKKQGIAVEQDSEPESEIVLSPILGVVEPMEPEVVPVATDRTDSVPMGLSETESMQVDGLHDDGELTLIEVDPDFK